jgi:hypothetical protein
VDARDARDKTDRKLEEMIDVLTDIYRRAMEEMDEKARKYFERFEKQDAKIRKKVEAGKITPEEYREWRKNKLLYGRRYKDFREAYTARLANVNEDALAYINGEMLEVYVANYNEIGTVVVGEANAAFDERMTFELVDADTVRILATEHPDLLPKKVLDIPKDQRWNAQAMQAEILQGILQGEDIPTISKRLRKVTDMNRVSAVRNARTMVTSAENRGRLEGMRRTSAMGIVQKKHWMSSDQPGRTREWHMPGAFRALTVDIEEPFENELGKIMYPGDPAAAPANVYNCRCTLATEVVGFIDPETGEYRRVEYGD